MKASNVRQMNSSAGTSHSQAGTQRMARVVQADDGHAVSVRFEDDGSVMPVAAHAGHLPALAAEDPVMVFPVEEGAIVAFALRRAGERPQQGFAVNRDGSLSVENDRAVTIRTAAAIVRLDADGRVQVDGREILSAADGRNRIQGTTIELN